MNTTKKFYVLFRKASNFTPRKGYQIAIVSGCFKPFAEVKRPKPGLRKKNGMDSKVAPNDDSEFPEGSTDAPVESVPEPDTQNDEFPEGSTNVAVESQEKIGAARRLKIEKLLSCMVNLRSRRLSQQKEKEWYNFLHTTLKQKFTHR
jgi:hypothetical protein